MGIVFAWRNIWRNKRRSVITLIALTFSAATLVFFYGLQLSTYDASIRATTRIFQGELQIQPEEYKDSPQIYRTLNHRREIEKRLDADPTIQAIAPRAQGFALVSSEDRTYGVQVIGVDPGAEQRVSTIPGLVRTGSFLHRADAEEVVLGEALARNLQVKPGMELTLLGQGKDGSLAAGVLTVRGVFRSGSADVDRSLIEIPLSTFQEIFSMDSSIHLFVVQTTSLHNLSKLQQDLSWLSTYSAVAWRWDQLNPGLKQAIELDMAGGWLFYSSLAFIVIIGVLNTFLMSILERTREFGMLLALGMKPGRITVLILTECFLLVSLGVILGALLGACIILYFGAVGFVIPGTEGFLELWNLPSAIYPFVSLRALVSGPLMMLLCSLIIMVPFSLRPFRLKPVSAMRGV